jgi:altronate dehydratase
LGAIAKAGSTRVEGVVEYGEAPRARGLHLMQGPGYDQESTPALVAGGATVVVFTTGRGSTMGNAIAPVIKLTSNSAVFQRMAGDMDLSAGGVIDGTESIDSVAGRLFEYIQRVASGEIQTKAEQVKHREFQVWGEQAVSL